MKILERIRITGMFDQYKNNVFLKRLSTVLIIDILARVSSIVLLPIYLRLMNQEEFGIYSYILSIITTFSVVLNFGLYVSQSKYYSDASSEEGRRIVLFNILFTLTTLLVLLIFPVYLFNLDYPLIKLLFKNDINYTVYRFPILLALIVSVYGVILSNFFITSERINHFRWYNLSRLILIHAVVLTCLFFSMQDKINVRLTYTYLTELTILLVFIFFYVKQMKPVFDLAMIGKSLKLGLPIMVSAIWGMFSTTSDKFFLERYGSAKELSCYFLAFSVSNLVLMISTSVQNAWLPTFLKEKNLQTNLIKTKKLTLRLAIGLLAFSAMLTLAFYIALKLDIIKQDYWLTIQVLPILLLAQILNSIMLIYSNYFISLEITHLSLFIGIFTSVIGLAGSYFLVKRWSILGAATIYLVIQTVFIGLYYIVINPRIKAKLYLELKQGDNV